MEEFKVGDTVRLKSGGPLMCVDRLSPGKALCKWFDTQGVKNSGEFALAALKKSDDEPRVG